MWFIPSAFAISLPCFEMQIAQHLPQELESGVPLDVAPVLVVDTSCGVGELSFSLWDEVGRVFEQTVPAGDFALDAHPTVLEFDLGFDLTPETVYTVDIAVDGVAHDGFSFRTGSGFAPEFDGAPGLEVLGGRRGPGPDGRMVAAIAVEPVGDGRLFLATADGEEVAVFTGSPGRFELEINWARRGDGGRFCMTVQERHLSGAWSAPSEEMCDRARRCSCAHGAAPTGLFAGLLVAALLCRRVRS